ncbi:uncharacterized protein LOC143541352 [Bidens hawaiensis]|uniref:uncharacterized protein LOC143541352 n=1 Tax=Bidens hawaiensis TaxID=980011 RepID=UPI004049504F
MGLQKDSTFYQDLVMTPCSNLDEVRNRALRFIRLEEDQRIKDQLNTPAKSETQDKKQGSYFRNNGSKPYSKPNGKKINAVKDEKDDEDCPRISNYCFSVDMRGVMLAVRSLGDKARWPRKNEKAPPPKDKSKWCSFHEDFGHMTEDCIALRREISYLLSKGYLKELFGRKKSRTQDPEPVPEKAAPPPPDAQVINVIFGGSDICGTSYSAAKKHAKESKLENGERPIRTSTTVEQKVISFDEDDRITVQDPHHDGSSLMAGVQSTLYN